MRAAAFVLLASCYSPTALRRERTDLSTDASAVMAQALMPEAVKRQRFDQHYAAALAFYNDKKYPEAIAEWEAAYEVDPHEVLIVFNIGQAYRKGGRLEEALAKYREYLEKDPAAERDQVKDIIKDVERALEQQRKTSPVR